MDDERMKSINMLRAALGRHLRGYVVSLLAGAAVGIVVGALWHKAWLFPFPQLSDMKRRYAPKNACVPQDTQPSIGLGGWTLQMPVIFLPQYSIQTNEAGKRNLVMERGKAVFEVSADNTALVLIDTWEEPGEEDAPSAIRKNQANVLEQCRKHGVTVIHAPNHPVADKYPQYWKIKAEVDNFMEATRGSGVRPRPACLAWPLPDNAAWRTACSIRTYAKAPEYDLHPISERQISRYLKPAETEYVLCSHAEFRCVILRHKITTLLYLGGALNMCLLHRDTGINSLVALTARWCR